MIKVLLVLSTCGSFVYYGRRALLISKSSIVTVLIKDPDIIELAMHGGGKVNGRLIEGSYINVYFSTIHYKEEGKSFTKVIPVFPDMLSQAQFRELRVWLRWKKIGQTSSQSS